MSSSRSTTGRTASRALLDDLAREELTGPHTHIYDDASPGREFNFEHGRVRNGVYFTATLDAAT